MADKKVSELSAITNLSGDDLLLVVNDPSGTPTSNKVTVSNLFANVVSDTVIKGNFTARDESTFFGSTLTVFANAIFNGTTTFNDSIDFDELSIGGTTVVGSNGKLHANNAISPDTITLSMINGIENYMEVANTNALVNDRIQVANAELLINDRLQVANAEATYVTNTSFQTYVANTNARLTVLESSNTTSSNTVSNTQFQSFVANTNARFEPENFVHASFTITANGTTGYCFEGSGAANTNNETLYLYKGFTYRFVNTTGESHPFQILNTAGNTSFSNGISGNTAGTQLFTVPHAQQSNLVYQCSIHSGMQGTLVIVT